MEDYESILEHYISLINERLTEVVKAREPENLYAPIEYILSDGGKRIRPLLCMFACETAGGDPYEAIDAGLAIEILHNFTLVHDDIMDNSPLRRGKTTIHLKWDLPTAILSGDAMIGLALKTLSNYSNYVNFGKMIEYFNYGYIEVCEGQALDMLFNNKKDVSEEDYFLMVRKKTAAVLQTSLVLGGLCGGAIERDIEYLKELGLNLGIAFQLQDDLLDLTADKSKLGKRIGNDIIEKKKTLIVILARERAKIDGDCKLIDKIFSNETIPVDLIPEYIEMFDRLEVFEDIKNIIRKYNKKSLETLQELPQNNGSKLLEYLLTKLNERSF
jgi:Geranylgeranyl pyrophosphate synthase